ncbi:unnamed protein product [Peniophora sp. CBMAI 1063]|nr:unnamed protein product [Peniophora sp. CBMAI 1063]
MFPTGASRPRLDTNKVKGARDDLSKVALLQQWRDLLDECYTYSCAADVAYEITNPGMVSLQSDVLQGTIQVLAHMIPERLREQSLTAINMFFVTKAASRTSVKDPSFIPLDALPWAMAVDARTADRILLKSATTLYSDGRSNYNGSQHPSISPSSSVQRSSASMKGNAASAVTVSSPTLQAQPLLEQLQSSGPLSAILAQQHRACSPVTAATELTTCTSDNGSSAPPRCVQFRSTAEDSRSAMQLAAHSLAPPKSILKTPLACPVRQTLATEELNMVLRQKDELQDKLHDAHNEIAAKEHELVVVRRELGERERQLRDTAEKFDQVSEALKRSDDRYYTTKHDLEGKLKRQGEELDEQGRKLKKIKECID